MVFSSIVFLCLFFPIVFFLYKICPANYRNLLLLVVSLVFYGWGEPKYLLVMIGSIAANYIFGLFIEKYRENARAKKIALVLSIAINLAILSVFKYTDFIIKNINDIFGSDLYLLKIALPIGISFYTFQAMSYTIDIYRNQVKAQHNIIDFAMYLSMFPQLIAGPIVRYSDIEGQIANRQVYTELMYQGLRRFVIGLGKKVLLANQIGLFWDEIYSYGGQTDAVTAWLGALFFTLQIYYDFSGYSDMAIGLGKIFGFQFPENFNYPYMSRSITQFWSRWHMTLSGWFKTYLYIPLGGNRKGMARQILNIFIVWSLTGLWHGASWNFVLWGIYFFIALVFEKVFMLKVLERIPKVFGHLYTIGLIMFSWVIFACDDIEVLGQYVRSLFGQCNYDQSMAAYYLSTGLVLSIIMIIGSTNLPKKVSKALEQLVETKTKKEVCIIVEISFLTVITALCVMMLIADSYNPFLYFRF